MNKRARQLAGLAALIICTGCSAIGFPLGEKAAAPVETAADNTAGDASGNAADNTVVVIEPEPVPFLTYEWDTGFSAFLSPPIEVRRQAKADCVSEGYQIAVVETLKLDGQIATAKFICRGDME